MEAIAISQAKPTFWASLREAIAGSPQDFTKGSLNRAIFLLAVPMVLEMFLESVFAVVDVFWVARLGPDALAAVGLSETLLILVYGVALGLGLSATAMVARRVGEKDRDGAATAAVQAIALAVVVGLVFGACGWIFGKPLLRLMGGSPSVLATGSWYARIGLGTSVVPLVIIINNAVFRGAGDAALAMRVLWISNFINLVLDPCLIFGWGPFPCLGVTGAAVATLIGRTAGILFQVWLFARGSDRLRILRRHVRLARSVLVRLAKVSLTGIAQFLVPHLSWICLMRIIAEFGAPAVASYTIGIRVILFVFLPSWGLSGAAATLVGQNLGAKQPDRAESAVWRTSICNMAFLGSAGVLLMIYAEPIARLFTSNAAVLPLAASCLRIISYGNVGYALGMVMLQAFNGAGDTRTPTVLNLIFFWLGEIPLAYVLANHTSLLARGVSWGIVIAESALAIASLLVFRGGRWKQQEI
jgi:putative MATE family efflux protein